MASKFQNEALDSLSVNYVLDYEGVNYKEVWGRSGRQVNIKTCPFCGNNNWKVYVNAETGLGNCFSGSCTQGTFNKWQLLAAIYDLSGPLLTAKINVMAINQGWRPVELRFEDFELAPLNLPASTPCHELPAMPRYLLGRGIDAARSEHFGLRYCESAIFEVKDPTGRISKQDYSKRIIIPIFDINGDLVSFQGRDATGDSPKRYLFPPMYASTGSQIYNIQNWKQDMDSIVLTEGPFDAIGVKIALDEGSRDSTLAAASFGMSFSESNFTDDQINRLIELKARGLKTVYILWDNELPAILKAIKSAVRILRYGFKVKVAVLEKSKDPGEAHPEEILKALDAAYDITSELQAMLLARKLTLNYHSKMERI